MATKPALRTVGKKKQPAAVQTSSSIEDKVKAFLKAGGEIEQVKSGISGQPSMAPPKAKPKPKPAESTESTEPAESAESVGSAKPAEPAESAESKDSS